MKYYMQKKAPSGNYYDANGTDNLADAISFADWWRGQEKDKTAARVVERTDVVVDEIAFTNAGVVKAVDAAMKEAEKVLADFPKAQYLRDVKEGDYFRINTYDKGTVYVRGHYCGNNIKKFSCTRFDDVNAERLFKGDKLVFTGFTF